MRRSLVALALIAMMSDALAGEFDVPILRGSEPVAPLAPVAPLGPIVSRWGGLYVGGHAGMGVANMDFARASQPVIAHMLRELQVENENHPSAWQIFGQGDTRSPSLGGVVGYNNTWECMIIGVDFTFSKVNYSLNAPVSPIRRVTATSSNLVYDMNLTGAASLHISDYGTLRVRAGVDLGNVLPYAGIGVAVGRAGVYRSATASGIEYAYDANGNLIAQTPFSFSESQTKSDAVIYGWSLSGGVDIMMMPNVFLRAEYEFVNFVALWDIKSSISTGRLGVAYKF